MLAGAGVLGAAGSSRAEGVAEFRVEYRAGSLCAESDRFSAALLARTANVRPARAGGRASLFRIEVGGTAGHLVGRLTLVEPDGLETVRVVPGATCDEVTSAMGVIAAVLIDSTVSSGVPASTVSSNVPASTVSSASATPMPPLRAAESEAEPEPPRRRAERWRAGAGMGLALEGAVAPDPVAGLSLEGALSRERETALSPEVRLGLIRTFADRVANANGTARFEWTSLRVAVSVVRWPADGALALRPCMLFDAGLLQARGERTDRPATASPPWFALGGAVRAEAVVLHPLSVAADAGFVAPLRRDRFYFDPGGPSGTVFRLPAAGFVARLGVSVQFD